MRVMILGLRRSGTTIFWRQFRRDARLVCYDEPFNPKLAQIPAEHVKRVYAEFIRLYEHDPAGPGRAWGERFAPIAPAEEPTPGLSEAQAAYLRWLFETGEHTVTDVTRCFFKMEALAGVAPGAVCVYLRRDPCGVASSHLLPSHDVKTLRNRLGRRYRALTFFTRRDGFDNWQFERIMREPAFDEHLRFAGLDPGRVRTWPAVGKLLAYWKAHDARVAHDGPRVFGERFLTVRFEDFCRDPRGELARVYDAGGLPMPDGFDASGVRPSAAPHREHDRRWRAWLAEAGVE